MGHAPIAPVGEEAHVVLQILGGDIGHLLLYHQLDFRMQFIHPCKAEAIGPLDVVEFGIGQVFPVGDIVYLSLTVQPFQQSTVASGALLLRLAAFTVEIPGPLNHRVVVGRLDIVGDVQ